MGAEVLKVERPGKGDSSRAMGDGSERNPFFRYINRNKKSVDARLQGPRRARGVPAARPEHRRPRRELPGDGHGAGRLRVRRSGRARTRGSIYAQLTGFGADGPYRDKGGVDLIAQGMGGLMQVTGEPDGPPTSVGQPICDLGTGMWGVQGILAALYERERTGRGPEGRLLTARDRHGLLRVDQRRVAGGREGADAPGGAPPPERAIPALRDPRRLPDGRRRDPGSLGALRPGTRSRRVDRRTRASSGTRDRLRHRAALEKEIESVLATRAHGPLGRGARRAPGCPPVPSTRTRSCSPIPRCATWTW